ncbi:MAG: glycosyltransferase family 2 protein [Lutibacter sp.]
MKQLISIIIPVFNREKLIEETLNSVIKQSYKNWECLLVDDNSTDKSVNIIEKYSKIDSRFMLLKRPKNRVKGANACRNYGFEKSEGEFIQWFDSDDIMHKDMLKIKLNKLIQNNVDFVVSEGLEFQNSINNIVHKWDLITSENPLIDHITGKINFHTNGPLFKRKFLQNKMLFNETLQRKQEWEFYSRLLIGNTNYSPINKPLYYFRNHDKSINGINDKNTLYSRIKSTNLVFKNSYNHLNRISQKTIRKFIINRQIFHFKLALKTKNIKLITISFVNVFKVLNLKSVLDKIFK